MIKPHPIECEEDEFGAGFPRITSLDEDLPDERAVEYSMSETGPDGHYFIKGHNVGLARAFDKDSAELIVNALNAWKGC